MCPGKVKVFLLLVVTFVFLFYFYGSTKAYSMDPNDDVHSFSNKSMIISRLSNGIINSAYTTFDKQKWSHKYQSLLLAKRYRTRREINFSKFNANSERQQKRSLSHLSDSNSQLLQINRKPNTVTSGLNVLSRKFLSDRSQKKKLRYQHVFDERVKKRNVVNKKDERKGLLKGKQKKAKALGRLLLNNVSNKNDEDIQDDYMEDDDDDYSDGVNKKKMNWEDYQNEDGASIMELIALNTRHKTYMQRDEYFY